MTSKLTLQEALEAVKCAEIVVAQSQQGCGVPCKLTYHPADDLFILWVDGLQRWDGMSADQAVAKFNDVVGG